MSSFSGHMVGHWVRVLIHIVIQNRIYNSGRDTIAFPMSAILHQFVNITISSRKATDTRKTFSFRSCVVVSRRFGTVWHGQCCRDVPADAIHSGWCPWYHEPKRYLLSIGSLCHTLNCWPGYFFSITENTCLCVTCYWYVMDWCYWTQGRGGLGSAQSNQWGISN